MIKTALLMCLLAGVLWYSCVRPNWHVEATPRVRVLGLELRLAVSVDLSPIPDAEAEDVVVRTCVADTVRRVRP